jgi:hypothetical protein
MFVFKLFFPFFLFKTAFSDIENNLIKQTVKDSHSCSTNQETVAEINFHYFEEQHYRILVDLSSKADSNIFKCIKKHQFQPIEIINDIKLIKIPSKKESISAFSRSYGFIIVSETVKEAFDIVKAIQSQNPRSKLLVLLENCTNDEAQEILREAFHKHKMLNVAVLLFTNEVELLMYNPYSGTLKVRNPQFIKFRFTSENDFDQMKIFMNERVRNLQGFPLKVNIFEFPMVSKPEYNDEGKISHYSYVDGEQLSVIAKSMNFKPIYDETFTAKYGFQFPNGTFVGALAEIEYERVELLANPRLISDLYNVTKAAFLQPLAVLPLSFIIRKRKRQKLIMISIYSQFDTPSKIISITLTVLFPIIYTLISKWEQKIINSRKKSKSITESVLYSFAIMNNISMKHSRNFITRFMVAIILFYALIMTTIFQSTFVKNLNTNQEIGKLSKIHQLVDEGYKIKMPAFVALIFKNTGLDKVSWVMNKTHQNYLDVAVPSSDLVKILDPDQKIAYLWNNLYVTNYLNQFYDNITGENLFEIIPEPAFQFYIALMAPKSSNFIESFNEVIIRYVEGGVNGFHVLQAFKDNDNVWIQRLKCGKIPKQSSRAIKFEDISLAFEIILCLYLIAFLVFSCEIVLNQIRKFKLFRSVIPNLLSFVAR